MFWLESHEPGDTHNRLVKYVIGGSRQQDDFITIPTAYDTANASGTWAVADEKLSDTSNAPARLLRDLPADTKRFAFTYESPNDPANTTDYDPEQYGLGIIRLEKPDAGNGNHYRYAAIVIEPTALYLREWKDDQVVAEHGSHIADSEPNTQYDIEINYSNGPELRDISVKWGKRGEPLEEIITGELDADLALDPAHVVGFGDGSEGDYKFADVNFYRSSDTSPTTEVTFAYDALGRRIQKVVGGSTTNYYYAGPHVIEERDGSDNVTATYVYGSGIDEIISMTRGSTDYYYHTDDLGNVMAITDDSGAVVERYAYGDYGAVSYFDGSDNPISTTAIGNPLLFNGRRYDEETDLYVYRTRYMDPSAGRFISRDTIGQWGDPNNHGNGQAYVGNNPWTTRDPFGRGADDVARLLKNWPRLKRLYEVDSGAFTSVPRQLPAGVNPGDTFFFTDSYASKAEQVIRESQLGKEAWEVLRDRYPEGVPFDMSGFPNFTKYVHQENGKLYQVKIADMTGKPSDFIQADFSMGIDPQWRKSRGLTWHHHQDMETMQLIPSELNNAVPHTGGAAYASTVSNLTSNAQAFVKGTATVVLYGVAGNTMEAMAGEHAFLAKGDVAGGASMDFNPVVQVLELIGFGVESALWLSDQAFQGIGNFRDSSGESIGNALQRMIPSYDSWY